MLGRFLELSLPAPRILESWHFYQRLGFASAQVGETWAHRYAVVTDGRIALGLHDAPLEGPTLTYVLPELASHLPAVAAAGAEFDFQVLGDEAFNEARFVGPAGQHVRLLEARTYSPPERTAPSLLGWFEEYAIPVTDLERARAYWERLGFVTAAEENEPWPHLSLTSDTLDIGLYLTRELAAPALVFSVERFDALRERLNDLGIEPAARLPRSLDAENHLMLEAPDSMQLLIGPPPN